MLNSLLACGLNLSCGYTHLVPVSTFDNKLTGYKTVGFETFDLRWKGSWGF